MQNRLFRKLLFASLWLAGVGVIAFGTQALSERQAKGLGSDWDGIHYSCPSATSCINRDCPLRNGLTEDIGKPCGFSIINANTGFKCVHDNGGGATYCYEDLNQTYHCADYQPCVFDIHGQCVGTGATNPITWHVTNCF